MTEPIVWINKDEIRYLLATKQNGGKDWKSNLGLIPEEGDVPLYLAPPKKEWVGLTDEEYQAIRYGYDENGERNVEYELFDEGEYGMEVNIYVDDFARAIEAKLKEKNT
jgi:hypothetical protein